MTKLELDRNMDTIQSICSPLVFIGLVLLTGSFFTQATTSYVLFSLGAVIGAVGIGILVASTIFLSGMLLIDRSIHGRWFD